MTILNLIIKSTFTKYKIIFTLNQIQFQYWIELGNQTWHFFVYLLQHCFIVHLSKVRHQKSLSSDGYSKQCDHCRMHTRDNNSIDSDFLFILFKHSHNIVYCFGYKSRLDRLFGRFCQLKHSNGFPPARIHLGRCLSWHPQGRTAPHVVSPVEYRCTINMLLLMLNFLYTCSFRHYYYCCWPWDNICVSSTTALSYLDVSLFASSLGFPRWSKHTELSSPLFIFLFSVPPS